MTPKTPEEMTPEERRHIQREIIAQAETTGLDWAPEPEALAELLARKVS